MTNRYEKLIGLMSQVKAVDQLIAPHLPSRPYKLGMRLTIPEEYENSRLIACTELLNHLATEFVDGSTPQPYPHSHEVWESIKGTISLDTEPSIDDLRVLDDVYLAYAFYFWMNKHPSFSGSHILTTPDDKCHQVVLEYLRILTTCFSNPDINPNNKI